MMLFGGRGRPENVKLQELGSLLDPLFKKKLGQFVPLTVSTIGDLERAKRQFIVACDEFEKSDPEPYTEDLYTVNINFIKAQKNLYAQTLRRLASSLVVKPEGAVNIYESYMLIASNLESVMNGMLKANATFKQVVHCYSNSLGNFKKAFSNIERLTATIRNELEKESGEFSRYKEVKELASRLNQNIMELESLKNNVETLKKILETGSGATEANSLDISKSLESKRSELSGVTSEILRTHVRMESLISPLGRAAKKFDHISLSKRKLHPFIENPLNSIENDVSCNEFRSLVNALKEAVDGGSIDVKNKAEVSRAISNVLGTDLLSISGSLKSLEQRRRDIEGEIGVLERSLNALKDSSASRERQRREMERMEEKAREVGNDRDSAKSKIEKLFSDYYGKLIFLVL
jgi:DNA repair exonuclease SbcCD ATPase subunit